MVISAGLSQPSSTRLLADRLSAATVEALARGRRRSRRSSCATSRTTSPMRCSPASRRPRCRRSSTIWRVADARHRRHADVQRVLQRAVQVVLRHRRDGRAHRHAGADRRDRRHRAALAGARPRVAADVHLPARERRAARRVRGIERLGRRRRRAGRADRSRGRGSSPRLSTGRRSARHGDAFDNVVSFETLLAG